jgi:hypothetical protein
VLWQKHALLSRPVARQTHCAQDTLRVGPIKLEACAAKCTTETAQGGRDTAWGARTFVRYDYLPGVGLLLDFYQQRTRETDGFYIMGGAANVTYDFTAAGCACGLELDYVPGEPRSCTLSRLLSTLHCGLGEW